jgi:hypothetical protein
MNDHIATSSSLPSTKPNGSASDDLQNDIRTIRESGLFDEAYYRANTPDLLPGADAVRHFLERGACEGRQPNRLFDPVFYLSLNPDVAEAGNNSLLHYIRRGAAEGRPPHPGFDPAFYLAKYPDVAHSGQNPLSHYLVYGEQEGRKPNTQAVGGSVAVTHAEIQCLKHPSFREEVALFVTYSAGGQLKPHVPHYLESLKRQGLAVVLIVNADGPFAARRQLDKVTGLAGMFVRRAEGYDFAAWAHILRLHPELFDAKILYLLNDSVIGPVNDRSLGAVLTRLRNSRAGLIGLTENFSRGWHLQSYFLALRPPALSLIALRKFIDEIVSFYDPEDVIENLEIPLAPTMKAAGVQCEALFPTVDFRDDPTLYLWKHLLQSGFPFIKVKTIGGVYPRVDISDWRELLTAQGYDVSLAERTLVEARAASATPRPPPPATSERARPLSSEPVLVFETSKRDRRPATSSALQRRPIVIVLGMHRSGTSLCSHILSALGVDMADDVGVDVGNDKGHWERWEIAEFHERILGFFNRGYSGGFHDFALPVAWWAHPQVAQIRRQILAFVEKRMGDSYFGFKDPRTMRLMPVWHQIFSELQLAPKLVLCLRNPAQIARSLNAREGLDPEIGEYRWLVHMIDFFRYAANFDFCTVEYEAWFSNPAANIEKIQRFLDLPWQQSEADLALVLSGIIDHGERHDDPGHAEPSQPLVRTLYKLARSAGQNEAREQITAIVAQFIGFQQLQRPFVRAFEDVAKTAAKYPEVEREAAALRTLVAERDAVVAAAEAKAASVEERLAEALAEIENQSAQIAELAGEPDEPTGIEQEPTALPTLVNERDAAIAAADAKAAAAEGHLADALAEIEQLQAQITELARKHDEHAEIERVANGLKTTLAEREAALAERSRRADELFKALEIAQAEVAARKAALLRAEQEMQEHRAAATAREGEITALRGLLAQAERTERERVATAEGKQAEVAALWDSLAFVRQEAEQQEAAGMATQREIARPQGTLARAEREGARRAAAMEALETELRGLREKLSHAGSEAKERVVAAEALRTELRGLRERLAQAVGLAKDRVAAVVALQAEVRGLRDRLAQALALAKDRVPGEAALRSEIQTLRDTLTAARQVGQTVITAFRIQPEAPAKLDRPRGWRRAVTRFFGARTSA